MPVINLLPWREEARRVNRNHFFIIMAVVIAGTLFFLFLIHLYINAKLNSQLKTIDMFEAEYAKENTKFVSLQGIKKTQVLLLNDINYIYTLRENCYLAVQLMNELARIIPDSIVLTSIQRQKNNVIVSGTANSSVLVTTFMENLAKAPFFVNPNIIEIVSKESPTQKNNKRYFKLTFQQPTRG